MIVSARHIELPASGDYEERIFDPEIQWKSSSWTYIKFTVIDGTQWCGVFRGKYHQVAISSTLNEGVVLTSDYIWKLNLRDGAVIESQRNSLFSQLTVSPSGEFILADFNSICFLGKSIKDKILLDSRPPMDMISFKGWEQGLLNIECIFLEYDYERICLILDPNTKLLKKAGY